MKPNFEWDEFRAAKNPRKHGISFQEAASIFLDEFSLTFPDIAHSAREERFIEIGCSTSGQILVVVYTERRNNIRIISCRKATTVERKIYETQSD